MASPTIDTYLAKHAKYPALITAPVAEDLEMIVVIPCYNEPNLESTLLSLSTCQIPNKSIEIIVVVNEAMSEKASITLKNKESLTLIKRWQLSENKFQAYSIYINEIPFKKAGVGYARKTGMDEAVRRFRNSNSEQQLIICLDADTTVEPNYFTEIHSYFEAHPDCPAAAINYAHPLDNTNPKVNLAILQYELHLRYYEVGQRWAGLPYAQQTVGSAMVVRADAYVAQGGMNTRKAGEDFYFMHKFTHHHSFGNITATQVIPSARISDRVPFGTGRAMQSLIEGEESLTTYAPQSFAAIKKLIDQLPILYDGDMVVKNSEPMSIFLRDHNFPKKVQEIRNNTTDFASFKKRFFVWFDAFRCMKFLHYSRDHHHPNISIATAANWLNKIFFTAKNDLSELELLIKFRVHSKSKK